MSFQCTNAVHFSYTYSSRASRRSMLYVKLQLSLLSASVAWWGMYVTHGAKWIVAGCRKMPLWRSPGTAKGGKSMIVGPLGQLEFAAYVFAT